MYAVLIPWVKTEYGDSLLFEARSEKVKQPGEICFPDKLRGDLSHYGDYRYKGETDYLEYEGHGIWGLTARILSGVKNDLYK